MKTIQDFIDYVKDNAAKLDIETDLEDGISCAKLNDEWVVYPYYDTVKDVIAMDVKKGDKLILTCLINYPTYTKHELIYSFVEEGESTAFWAPKMKTDLSSYMSRHRMLGVIPTRRRIENILGDLPEIRPEPIRELVQILLNTPFDRDKHREKMEKMFMEEFMERMKNNASSSNSV